MIKCRASGSDAEVRAVERMLGSAEAGRIAEDFGVLKAASFSRYVSERAWERGRIPEPDVAVGRYHGWRDVTVASWLMENGVGREAHTIVRGPTGMRKGPEPLRAAGFAGVVEAGGSGGRAVLKAGFLTDEEDPPRQVFRAALENLIYCRARELGLDVAVYQRGTAKVPPPGHGPLGAERQLEASGETYDVAELAEIMAMDGAGGFIVEVEDEDEADELRYLPAEIRVRPAVHVAMDGGPWNAETREAEGGVYGLRVTLRDTDTSGGGLAPEVWRHVRVEGATTMQGLHEVLQAAMGWEDSHLYSFFVGGAEYGEGSEEVYGDEESERRFSTALAETGLEVGDAFAYEYDFGDRWRHDVRVVEFFPPERGWEGRHPWCVDGAGACPPEDCGGNWRFREAVRALFGDGEGEMTEAEAREVLPWGFDPGAFDRDEANWMLGALG